MDPVTEVVSISLKSDDANQPLSQVFTDTLLQQPGCLRVRWGLTYEDATKARCFIDWENISLHEQFRATPSYQPFVDKLGALIESAQLHHVKFHPTSLSVLNNESGKGKTPVVEVLHMHFASDDSFTPEMKDKATANAEQFLAEAAPVAKGSTGETAMGWAIENVDFNGEPCRALAVLIGWESIEAHQQFRDSEAFAKTIPLLRKTEGLKGVSVVHVSLTTTERSD